MTVVKRCASGVMRGWTILSDIGLRIGCQCKPRVGIPQSDCPMRSPIVKWKSNSYGDPYPAHGSVAFSDILNCVNPGSMSKYTRDRHSLNSSTHVVEPTLNSSA